MRNAICWAAVLAVLCACSRTPAAPVRQPEPVAATSAPAEQDARSAAEAWLNLIDREDYDGSWQQAAQRSQALFPREQWTASLRSVRAALGRPQVRELVAARTIEAPPGAPAGEYMELEYRRRFENDASATEYVILVREGGRWRGFGYRVSRVPRSGSL